MKLMYIDIITMTFFSDKPSIDFAKLINQPNKIHYFVTDSRIILKLINFFMAPHLNIFWFNRVSNIKS